MEKLILDNTRDENDFYQLEINDNGDYIEFDLTDLGLAERIIHAGDELGKIEEEFIKELEKIYAEDADEITKAKKQLKLSIDKDNKKRKLFDGFLGEGTCDKIFGNKRTEKQYFLLLDALEPHFQKMNFQIEKAKERLAQKYLPKDEDVM